MTGSNRACDAVVVGAGYAGAVVARELAHRGHDIVVVEARDRIGGRAMTVRRWGREVDVGGQALTWMQPHVWSEVTRYGLEIYDRPPWCDAYLLCAGVARRYEPDALSELIADGYRRLYGHALAAFERPYEPLRHDDIQSLDRRSVGDALRALALARDQQDAVDAALTVNFNGPIDEGAFTQGARRLALAMGQADLLGAVVRWRLVGGAQQLPALILADARCEVRLSALVASVGDERDRVEVMTRDGDRVHGRFAIVTVPIHALRTIAFDPSLNGGRAAMAAAGQVSRGAMIWLKVHGPERPFIAYAPGRHPLVFMACDGQADDGGWIVQAFAPDRQRLDVTDRAALEHAVRQWFPDARVDDCVAHDWVADEFSGETWAMLAPGQLTEHLADVQAPHGRVVLAGADYASGWAGYFDGAVESAYHAARTVQAALA